MRNVRKRPTSGERLEALLSRLPGKAALTELAKSTLLVPPARLLTLYRHLRDRLHALGLCRTFHPDTVAVGVGGMAAESRGRVLLTSWLLGWAKARGVTAAVAAPPGEGHPPVMPYQVTPGDALEITGIETALLASYVPDVPLVIDASPIRGARTAMRAFAPDLLVLEDALADPRLAVGITLAILSPDDLGPGWNQMFPAGHWRRDISALARADAFCIFAAPHLQATAMAMAQKRLGTFGKPVFGLSFTIWRWHGPEGPVPREALAGEPYIAVLGESDRDMLPEMLRRQMGASPRMVFFVHDRHRFTLQDYESLRADALRLKTKNILTSPRLAIKLAQAEEALDGFAVWTYDPEVVFGPSLFTDVPFLSWWEAAYAAAGKKHTP